MKPFPQDGEGPPGCLPVERQGAAELFAGDFQRAACECALFRKGEANRLLLPSRRLWRARPLFLAVQLLWVFCLSSARGGFSRRSAPRPHAAVGGLCVGCLDTPTQPSSLRSESVRPPPAFAFAVGVFSFKRSPGGGGCLRGGTRRKASPQRVDSTQRALGEGRLFAEDPLSAAVDDSAAAVASVRRQLEEDLRSGRLKAEDLLAELHSLRRKQPSSSPPRSLDELIEAVASLRLGKVPSLREEVGAGGGVKEASPDEDRAEEGGERGCASEARSASDAEVTL